MVDGDLYLKGKGLIIKKPAVDTTILAEMEAGFSSQNALAEVVERKVDGLLGREPIWSMLKKDGSDLTAPQEKSAKEMSAAIVKQWNERRMIDLLRLNYHIALCVAKSELHPFVPPAFKDESGKVLTDKSKSPAQALESLHFETLSAADAGVFLQAKSRKPYSIYKYAKDEKTVVEFSFVDADGLTHFKIFTEEQFDTFLKDAFPTSLGLYQTTPTGRRETTETAANLGGKLFLHELDLQAPFVTDSMKRNQLHISLAKTMKGRNTYTAGFRERHWLNVQKPKRKIIVPDPSDATKQIEREVDAPLTIGAGVATYSQGSLVRNDEAKVIGQATPSLHVIEPVSVKSFIESKDDDYLSILCEASQTHVLANDAAHLSGVSRKDSRSEHEKKLKRDKPPVDSLGRYVIEFMMAYAAFVTERTAEFEIFRVDFNCIVDAGLPTPEEKADNRAAYLAGEISLQTLRSRNGIEDTDSEESQIKSEDGYEFNWLTKAAKAYSESGGAVPFAAFVSQLPIDEEKKTQILQTIKDNQPPPPTGQGLPVNG